jgi:hypothetical protein
MNSQSRHFWLHSKLVDKLSTYLPNISETSLLVIIAHYADGPLLVKRIKMYNKGCEYYETKKAHTIRVHKEFYYILEQNTNKIYQVYKTGNQSGQIAYIKGQYSHVSQNPTSIAFANDVMFSCKIDLFSTEELRYQRSFGESIVHRPVSCWVKHDKLFIVDFDGVKVFSTKSQAFFYTIPRTLSYYIIQGVAAIQDLVYIMTIDLDQTTKIQIYRDSTFIDEIDISLHLQGNIGHDLHSYHNRLIISTRYELFLFDSNLEFISSYSFPFPNQFRICTDDQHFYIFTHNGTLLVCI